MICLIRGLISISVIFRVDSLGDMVGKTSSAWYIEPRREVEMNEESVLKRSTLENCKYIQKKERKN